MLTENEFIELKNIGLEIGFNVVESGSLVRSSYHADEQARIALEKIMNPKITLLIFTTYSLNFI